MEYRECKECNIVTGHIGDSPIKDTCVCGEEMIVYELSKKEKEFMGRVNSGDVNYPTVSC